MGKSTGHTCCKSYILNGLTTDTKHESQHTVKYLVIFANKINLMVIYKPNKGFFLSNEYSVVKWLRRCQDGVKPLTINQSKRHGIYK